MAITKLNNKAVANVTSIPVALGDMVLVSSATASSSASIEFTLGNYKEYKFFFVNMHPSVDAANFEFQVSIDSGSTYSTTVTSTFFGARHNEADTAADITYKTGNDQAQGTAFQNLSQAIGADNDQNLCGTLQLFNPNSTTFVKHFIYTGSRNQHTDYEFNDFVAGYFNDTNDLTNIKFQMNSGNIDAGKILMFGIN
jgi:hypothetical protein